MKQLTNLTLKQMALLATLFYESLEHCGPSSQALDSGAFADAVCKNEELGQDFLAFAILARYTMDGSDECADDGFDYGVHEFSLEKGRTHFLDGSYSLCESINIEGMEVFPIFITVLQLLIADYNKVIKELIDKDKEDNRMTLDEMREWDRAWTDGCEI